MSAALEEVFAFEQPIESAVHALVAAAGVTDILTRGQYALAKDTRVEVRLDPGAADPDSLCEVGANGGMEYISRAGLLEITVASDRRREKDSTGPRLLHDAILARSRSALIRKNAPALNALLHLHVVTDLRDAGVVRSLSDGIDVSVLSYAITFEIKPSAWPTG